MKYKYKNRQ